MSQSVYKLTRPDSVKNDWEWFAVSCLTITAVEQIVVASDECEQQVGHKEDLRRRYHQSYSKVEVGVGTAGVDPQVPQYRCHYNTDTVHYCRQEYVASVCGQVAPHWQQRQIERSIAE